MLNKLKKFSWKISWFITIVGLLLFLIYIFGPPPYSLFDLMFVLIAAVSFLTLALVVNGLVLPFVILNSRNELITTNNIVLSTKHKLVLFIPLIITVVAGLIMLLLFAAGDDKQLHHCNILSYKDWLGTQNASFVQFFQSILSFIFFLILVALKMSYSAKDKIMKIAWKNAVLYCLGILIPAIIFLFLVSLNSTREKSVDSRRIADLKQVLLASELYLDVNSEYAKTLSQLAPTYIPEVPQDPCAKEVAEHVYEYKLLPDGSFIIRALLSNPENAALDNDLDGNFNGLWCGEQGKEIEYCVAGY